MICGERSVDLIKEVYQADSRGSIIRGGIVVARIT
jgi:hypothetical protein